LPLVVTLSSIPPRFSGLGPTLKSLLAQKVAPDEVRLYLPRRYRRFPDWDGSLPVVPDGVRIVMVDEDLGPATKILPAVRDFRGQDCELLLCDDDRLYDPLWTSRFLAARRAHPACVIAEAGGFVPGHTGAGTGRSRAVARRKDWRYRLLRVGTLGLVKPHAWLCSGHVDLFKGYGGAMLRPEFMPDRAFDIPDLLWTVDDPWLSGNLALNGVGIWLNADGRVPGERRIARCHALLDFALQGKGRGDANGACYQWFQQNLGVWPAALSRPSLPPDAAPADSR
jgi:hypothetical protein